VVQVSAQDVFALGGVHVGAESARQHAPLNKRTLNRGREA
jgi:hypothetical protein